MAVCNVHDFILSASALSSYTLDLSRKEIIELPKDLPDCNKLESLYLEGNRLTKLPDSLFISCPNLRWLDLRNNQLKMIPASIEKLKSLRTLLLEGNQLVSLPVQLSRLSHLTGLNISHNPLEDPPKHVTNRGTRAVLSYLREMIKEDDRVTYSSDSTSSLPDSGVESGTYIPLKPIETNTETVNTANEHSGSESTLPLPLMKQATLHKPEFKHHLDSLITPHKKKRKTRKVKGSELLFVPLLRTQDVSKADINYTLDKIKSKQGLEDWRDLAKIMTERQRQVKVDMKDQRLYPKVAPFATETASRSDESSQAQSNLKAMDDQQMLGYRNRESEIEERIKLHMSQLEKKRKQAGIISTPSSVLKEAEKHLAEALTMQEELENRKSREYRLTAFTGNVL